MNDKTEPSAELQVVTEQELAPIVSRNQLSPIEIMQQAKAIGMTTEDMKQMFELQKDYEANEARKAYHLAMSKFKADPPVILKNKNVSYGSGSNKTSYSHATLDQVASAVGEGLSEHGLSFGWVTEQIDGGQIKVTCTITHRDGHSESTSLQSAADTSGGKNSIQAIGSTVSYLERYTLLAITGTASQDMDDDGGAGGHKVEDFITLDQEADLLSLIEEVGADLKAFLKVCKIESLDAMLVSKLAGAIKRLEEKRK